MKNETLGKENFKNLIKQVYQQTSSILTIEKQSERLALIRSLKNFEANYVYNWQRFIYPIFSGPEASPYKKYSGFRSAPWAEYDVLDPEFGGASGWTLTAEPWATAEGLPCLWDFTRGQPNSITGALYCLSSRIDQIKLQEFDFEEYDDTEIRSLINCNTLNIETLYKDIYACDIEPDCSGENKLRYSFQRHFYEIFKQIISGGPDMSGDFSCEDDYPELFLNLSTCDISWDPSCPLVELDGEQISGGAKIQLTNNGSPYDDINVIGSGGTTISWDENSQTIEVNSGDADTTYDLSSKQNGNNVDIDLTDSSSTVDTVTLVPGDNISITDNGSNEITISSTDTDTQNTYTNEVSSSSTPNSVDFKLVENGSTDASITNILGEGTVSITRVDNNQYKISGSESVIGLVDSNSVLGQDGLTPIPAPDYYRENRDVKSECCYEYDAGNEGGEGIPFSHDEWAIFVASGGMINNANNGPQCFAGNITNEYSFSNEKGMSVSFWVLKDEPDKDAKNINNSRCTVFNITGNKHKGANLLPKTFSIFFNHNDLEPDDSEDNGDYCLYLEVAEGDASGQGVSSNTRAMVKIANWVNLEGSGKTLINKWTHVTISWVDLSYDFQNFKSYINGDLVATDILQTSNGSGIETNNALYEVFSYSSYPARNFKGGLKKLAIYNQFLTEDEANGVMLASNYTDDTNSLITSTPINGKLVDWWDLGNLDTIIDQTDNTQADPITSGKQLSQDFQLNSRLQSVNYNGTSIVPPPNGYLAMQYGEFTLNGSVSSGQPVTSTAQPGEVVIEFGGNHPPTGSSITFNYVMAGPSTYSIEQLTFQSTSDLNEHGQFIAETRTVLFYEGTDFNGFAYSLFEQIMITSGTFIATWDLPTYTLTVRTGYRGTLANQPVILNKEMADSTISGQSNLAFTGGANSGVVCGVPGEGIGAEATLTVNIGINADASVELISADGTSITYIAVDDGDPDIFRPDAQGRVRFPRGQTDSYPAAAGLKGLAKAIDLPDGHNAGNSQSRFQMQVVGDSLRIRQSQKGQAGNTPITIVDLKGSIIVSNPDNTGLDEFSGGVDGQEYNPENKEWLSQTALFNKWDCSTLELDLTIGNRYDITLTGYNTFKLATTPWCIPLETNGIVEEILSSSLGYVSIVGGTLGELSIENIIHVLAQLQKCIDLSGIGLNIRNENSCIEDPRNIFIASNYFDLSNHIKSMLDVNQQLGATSTMNSFSKSVHLGKYSFRSFFSKWKINLSLTVGPPSDGDPRKVNLYYKGEGVEIDLMKDVFGPFIENASTPGNLAGDGNYGLPQGDQDIVIKQMSLTTSHNPKYPVPTPTSGFFNEKVINRFEMDHYNPFRHTFYRQWDPIDIYAMGIEDLSKRMEGNVIENIAKETINTLSLQSGQYYQVFGTVANTTSNIISVGTKGHFAPLISEFFGNWDSSNTEEIEFKEYPGEIFYLIKEVGHFNFESAVPLSPEDIRRLEKENKWAIWEVTGCVTQPFNRMEVVTWGFDSGIFSDLPGEANLYAEPDGDIWTKVYLEEFTVKKFVGESLCPFEGLTRFSSVDFHWSGGPRDSNCGTCTEWKISDPFDWKFYGPKDLKNGSPELTPEYDVYYYHTFNMADIFDETVRAGRVYHPGDCNIDDCPSVIPYAESILGYAYYLPDYKPDGSEDDL